jgi:hypothetical protein
MSSLRDQYRLVPWWLRDQVLRDQVPRDHVLRADGACAAVVHVALLRSLR